MSRIYRCKTNGTSWENIPNISSGPRKPRTIMFQVCPSNVRVHDNLISFPLPRYVIPIICIFRIESSADTTDETKRPEETSQLVETEKPQPIALFLLLDDTRALGSDVVPGLSPCWDHVIHIVQSRNIPLNPKDVRASSLAMHCVDKHKEKSKI